MKNCSPNHPKKRVVFSFNDSYAESIERVVANTSISSTSNEAETPERNDSDKTKNLPIKKRKLSTNDKVSEKQTNKKQKLSPHNSQPKLTSPLSKKLIGNGITPNEFKENNHANVNENSVGNPDDSTLNFSKLIDNNNEKLEYTNENLPSTNGLTDQGTKKTSFPKQLRGKKKNLSVEIPSVPSQKTAKSPSMLKSILINNSAKSVRRWSKSKLKNASQGPVLDQKPAHPQKIKFEESLPGQVIELPKDTSIEAMTELIRQKRIRPPYGQPFSVTG